ncbi:MAG: alanine--glyoxylate aminotransferase family protein [Desulfovibrionaceae bacterium]|nr:alanine--glyoxylate aminotransferase family protein [Desulfovibrionaceae bacterium]
MLNKPRLLTPGPTALPESVRLAMAVDMIHHRKPAFKQVMAEIQVKLRHLFGTEQPVLPLSSSGTGAMTAALCNLFQPGEKVLILEGGNFGRRWAEIAHSRGLKTVVESITPGQAADPERLAALLKLHPELRGVCVQLCETSTGVQHPVRELAAITSIGDALLLVDGISGVGISPCPMDQWGIDCLLTGSQKGLMLPPGLSFVAFSARAWGKAAKVDSGNFYFDLGKEKEQVLRQQTCFTPPVSLLLGLNQSLDLFFSAGLEEIYRKQWALCSMAHRGVRAIGLKPFAPEAPAWGVTAVRLPEGLKSSALLAEIFRNYNLVLAAGQGEFKENLIRIGHMGWVDWADLAAALHALQRSCRALGGPSGAPDYLEQALAEYWLAMEQGYPS